MKTPHKIICDWRGLRLCLLVFSFILAYNSSFAQFQLNGSAASLGGDCYELTPAQNNQSGSMWNVNQVDLGLPFSLYVRVNLGCSNAGADGMAFVLQQVNVNAGSSGGGIGYQGIAPSFAIEFDTYQNGGAGDPGADHMAMQANGNTNHNSVANLAGPVSISPSGANVEDCQQHDVKITWDPVSQTMQVFFDCNLRLSYTGDIVTNIFGGNPDVFWGFTAATGGAVNLHDVCFDYSTFLDGLTDTTVCVGTSFVKDAGFGNTYSWSPTTGVSDPTIAAPTFTPLTTTTYTVTITDLCGATRTDQFTATILDTPIVDLGPDTNRCVGDTITLASLTPFAPVASYLWSTGETTPTLDVNISNLFWLEVTYPGGCSFRDSINLSFEFPVTVDIGNDSALCAGDTYTVGFNYTGTSQVGTTLFGADYLWSTGDVSDSIAITTQGTYWLDVTNACGTFPDTVTVLFDTIPSLTLPNDTILCAGDSFSIDISFAGPLTASYLWQDSTTDSVYTISSPGLYWAEIDNGCGIVRDTIIVQGDSIPIVDLGNDTLLCEGSTVQLDATYTGALPTSYLWQDNSTASSFLVDTAGLFYVNVSNTCGVGIDSIIVEYDSIPVFDLGADTSLCDSATLLLDAYYPNSTYVWQDNSTNSDYLVTGPGVYTVQVTNVCGTFGDTIIVNYFQTPNIDLGPDTTLCIGDSLILDATTGGATYIWQDNSTNPTYTVTSQGLYFVTVTNICGADADSIQVNYIPPPSVDLGDDTTLCLTDSIILDATFGFPGTSYLWQDSTTDSVYVVTQEGDYYVTLTNICGSASDTVRIDSSITADFTVSQASFCEFDTITVTYTGNADSAIAQYFWTFGGGTIVSGSGVGPYVISYSNSGNVFISLTVSQSGCTTNPVVQPIEIKPVPTATFSIAQTVCDDSTALIYYTGNADIFANYIWDFDGGLVLSGSGQGPYEIRWLSPGVKTVCLQVGDNGCASGVNCQTIEVLEQPVAGIGPVANQCFSSNNFNFSYTGDLGVNAYLWDFGSGANPPTSSAQNPIGVSYATPGIKTVTLQVSENGCLSDPVSVSFEVVEDPSADFAIDYPGLCQGDSCFGFTYLGTQNAGQTYAWNFGSQGIPQSSNLINPSCIIYPNVGTFPVTLTVDYKGCVVTTNQQVEVYPNPVANAGPDVEFCEGEGGITLNGTVYGGVPPYQYEWTCNDPNQPSCGLNNPFTEDPNANPDSTTVYYFQATDANGCVSNIDSVVVTVKPKPVVDAGPDLFICETGPGVVIQAQFAPTNEAPGPYTYQWTPTTGMSAGNSTVLQPYVRPDTTTIYTLLVSSVNGCNSQTTTLDTLSTVTVHVNAEPVADAGPDFSICLGDSIELQGTADNAGPAYTYQWTPSDPTIIDNANDSTPVVFPNQTTTFELVVNSGGCPSVGDFVTVEVNTLPTASAGQDKDICSEQEVLLNGFAAGDPNGTDYTYSWSPTTGLNNPNASQPTASPVTTTTYYLTVGEGGCEGFADSVVVTVRPTAVATVLTPDSTICAGDSVQLTGSHFFNTPPAAPVLYQWTPAAGLDDPFATNPIATPSQSTTYTLTVSVSNDCPTTDAMDIQIVPQVSASIVADTTRICQGDATILTAVGGIASQQYTWSPDSTVDQPTSGITIVRPDTTTTYQVIIQEGSCEDSAEITVVVNPTPVADYFASQSTGCVGLAVSFLENTENATQISWNFGDGSSVSNQLNPSHVYSSAGSYVVTLTATGVGGCEDVATPVTVNISDTSFANFVSSPLPGETMILNEATVEFQDLSVNPMSWAWDFGDNTTSSQQSPIHNYSSSGEYMVSLTVTNEDGCSSTITQGPYTVLAPDLTIPNVFSPNGDGFYDTWNIMYEGVELFEVYVYDRWGKQVFYSDAITEQWDGTLPNGSNAREGVYYYSVRVGEKDYTGNLTVMR